MGPFLSKSVKYMSDLLKEEYNTVRALSRGDLRDFGAFLLVGPKTVHKAFADYALLINI
jgi:hypothetical protein